MKRLLLATVAFGMLALPAMAADMAPAPAYYKAPVPVPVCIWCGFYVGVNAGGGWSDDSVNVGGYPIFANPAAAATGPLLAASVLGTSGSFGTKGSGFIGGGQIGYNWQFGAWVAGVETDFQGASINGSNNTSTSVVPGPGVGPQAIVTGISTSSKLDYLGTVRGRLGYTVTPSLLLYGTGGLAYGEVSSTTSIGQQDTGPIGVVATTNLPYASSASASSTRAGWTAGAGLEWMFMPRWSVKAEYLHYDLGSTSYNNTLSNIVGPPGGAVPTGGIFYTLGARSTASFAGDIVRAGLNMKF
jgi:outer membrane immunogenic protein